MTLFTFVVVILLNNSYVYLMEVNIMRVFKKYITKIFHILMVLILSIKTVSSEENIMDESNILFDQGKYIEAVNLASKILSIESFLFRANTLAIYGHFILEGEEALNVFKEARGYAEKALEIDITNDAAHLEVAHTMGRYSQLIGVLSALKQGYAEKIAFHLDEAIKLNPRNVSAQISKGTWHAEIVNKAGFMSKILYGATSDFAREHYKIALRLDINNIGILYEVANGLILLEEKEDVLNAKRLLLSALEIKPKNHLDHLYLNKVKFLIEKL